MDQIRVVFLGTSGGSPSSERNLASLAVVFDGRVILLDCGEGTQYRLLQGPVSSGRIEAIFITHLHGDHLYGLPGLLATLGLNGRTDPLAVFGPAGIEPYLRGIFETSRLRLRYDLSIRECGEGEIADLGGLRVVAARLEHSVECLGFALVEDDHPGRFDLERARSLGIPAGPLYGRLQRGEDVEIDGRPIRSSEVVGPRRRGRRIVYCTDTRPCDGAVGLAREADVLIHEATFGSDMAAEARERFHSTAAEAAEVARRAAAGRLIITHFSPRYRDVTPLVEEARGVFPATEAAADLTEFAV
ncbi:MAG TPA: ribonuclease Z [Thermoanaerobaculia bacterium]|nr:ribonuclease Z [Thermoanaerobaculia bacterium]